MRRNEDREPGHGWEVVRASREGAEGAEKGLQLELDQDKYQEFLHERGLWGREKCQREGNIYWLPSHTRPDQGTNQQPGYVPQPGI